MNKRFGLYWYDMTPKQIIDTKKDILKNISTNKILLKHNININQFELICKFKLQMSSQEINTRLLQMEELKGENHLGVHCEAFGTGKVLKCFKDNMIVKFENKELPIMAIRDGKGWRLSTTANPRWHKIQVSTQCH